MNTKKKISNRKLLLYVLAPVFAAALALRIFVFEIYTVERNSMNNTFFEGNKVVVNKLEKKSIGRNDVVVFRLGSDVYIKRCIGLPGETVAIKSGKVFIGGKEMSSPAKAILPDVARQTNIDKKYVPDVVFLDLYGKYWDHNNFGPYVIPKKGMQIQLTNENLALYKHTLESAGELAMQIDINKEKLVNQSYTFKRSYYFVLGDNRPVSEDSRVLGAIDENLIIGKICFTF